MDDDDDDDNDDERPGDPYTSLFEQQDDENRMDDHDGDDDDDVGNTIYHSHGNCEKMMNMIQGEKKNDDDHCYRHHQHIIIHDIFVCYQRLQRKER